MQRLENFFHKTLIKNGVLNERILKLDYNCWRVSLEYLRDCTTVQKFFSYTKLVNYMYSTLYELHRDLFPSELIRVRGNEFSKVDCLSRLPSSEILPDDVEVLEVEDAMLNNVPLDLERIREAQVDDKIISIVSQLVLTTFPKYINPLPAEENL
uniref:CDT1 domain-containing protein n=1 Tax=Strongyloides stercoralis TaxID=6248 RepID=A0A0K0E5Z3_STRER